MIKTMSILSKVKKGQSNNPPRIMLLGVEGVGKSTAGASMPSPVFLCGEDGLVGNQFADVASITPESWKDVLDFVDALASEKTDYKTLVIDTLDWIEPILYEHTCTRYGQGKVHSIEEFGFGKGYVLAQTEARQLIAKLDRLNKAGFAVMILAHTNIKAFQNPTGDNFDRYEPKVNGKIAGLFKEWCDCVLFAQFDIFTDKKGGLKAKAYGGQDRIVQTTHSAAWDAKNRYGLPETMPLDMGAILEAIAAGQPQDDSSMVKELESLIAKMPQDKAKKTSEWLKKGGWTTQQLAQVINKARFETKGSEAPDGV